MDKYIFVVDQRGKKPNKMIVFRQTEDTSGVERVQTSRYQSAVTAGSVRGRVPLLSVEAHRSI